MVLMEVRSGGGVKDAGGAGTLIGRLAAKRSMDRLSSRTSQLPRVEESLHETI